MPSCRRCHAHFDPQSNHAQACRLHSEGFSGETRQRWAAPGDEAKGGAVSFFYSCCGAANIDAPGCTASHHVSYDEALPTLYKDYGAAGSLAARSTCKSTSSQDGAPLAMDARDGGRSCGSNANSDGSMPFVTASGYVFFQHDAASLPALRERMRSLIRDDYVGSSAAPGADSTPADTAAAAAAAMAACPPLHLSSMRGTILLSTEGANVLLCGSPSQVAEMKRRVAGVHASFEDVHYKDTRSAKPTLSRYLVKIKSEIISMGCDPAMTPARTACPAQHLEPAEFKAMLDNAKGGGGAGGAGAGGAGANGVVVLDTRNDYEVRLGTFGGALDLDIKYVWLPMVMARPKRKQREGVMSRCTV